MKIIYRTTFAIGFSVKANRDEFQAKVITEANKICTELDLKTRVLASLDVTTDTEKGYEWFDKDTRDAVWASRISYAFESEAENTAFHDALVTKFGSKDVKYNYYVDSVGKVGAFNTQKATLKELTDTITQVEIK